MSRQGNRTIRPTTRGNRVSRRLTPLVPTEGALATAAVAARLLLARRLRRCSWSTTWSAWWSLPATTARRSPTRSRAEQVQAQETSARSSPATTRSRATCARPPATSRRPGRCSTWSASTRVLLCWETTRCSRCCSTRACSVNAKLLDQGRPVWETLPVGLGLHAAAGRSVRAAGPAGRRAPPAVLASHRPGLATLSRRALTPSTPSSAPRSPTWPASTRSAGACRRSSRSCADPDCYRRLGATIPAGGAVSPGCPAPKRCSPGRGRRGACAVLLLAGLRRTLIDRRGGAPRRATCS